jgi:hypothetical protein
MASFHQMDNLKHASLEEVLLRLYPVTFLKWLYDVSLRQLAEAFPAALPPPDRSQRFGPDKAPNKACLVTLLLAVLRNPELGSRFLRALPNPTRAALAAAAWARRVNLAALEATLGVEVAKVNPEERRRYFEPLLLPVEHGFLALARDANGYSSYYAYGSSDRTAPNKADFAVFLPESVRKVFRALVPPPAGFELEPIDNLPTTSGRLYACADSALTDLRLVAEYIAQGHLKYTKSEQVGLTSLKAVCQMTRGSEFFERSEDTDLHLLRTRLLVGGIAFAGAKDREALLTAADGAGPVRDLAEKLLHNGSFLHEELLGHLANRQNRWVQYSLASIRQIPAFFARLPAGKWISWENLRRYHELREQVPTLFGPESRGLEAQATTIGRENWSRFVTITEDTEFELVGEPLLKGFAFLLAAFGLAEIAYNPPTHPKYRRPKKAYLTPYDGLRFARLTPLGEFVFRRRDTYELAGGPPTRVIIVLDEARLLATCRNADPLTELALAQFMEKLAPGRYHMTPKSLVGGCHSREDLEERIRLFRRVVSASPPAKWETFFERTLARTAPLEFERDYLVLKVGADEEIRRLLTSDPVLQEVVLKVEGLRIAVRRQDLKKLARRLEQFGYLSPLPSIAAAG